MLSITPIKFAVAIAAVAVSLVVMVAGQECGPSVGNCSLNLCCSSSYWCGIDEAHCVWNCLPEYGPCTIPAPPSCSGNPASQGRKVGYYQAEAASRACNTMSPNDINLADFTHMLFAFATFDPNSFAVGPESGGDVPLFTEFTNRKTGTLQTWISIGGGSFGAAPFQAMTSSSSNRNAFITSLVNFMQQYGFQGADIDWEFPQNAADRSNYVSLLSEMRTAFGPNYGISITLPFDYASLMYFDPHTMQSSVDFFNFMSYDYAVPSASAGTIQAHTDMTKTAENLGYIWASGTDPAKVNLGIAYYAYSYTLPQGGCTQLGCGAADPGAGAGCTHEPDGVLPDFELTKIRLAQGITPYVNGTAMVAQMQYDGNQFVAFDMADTMAMKLAWADQHCLGGVMVWAVSFATVGDPSQLNAGGA